MGTLQARTAEPWCSRTGTLQDRTAEAWRSEQGHYGPERPNPGVPGRGHYRTERPRRGARNGDITGLNGRTPVFPDGTLQDKTAEASCSERGHYRPERPNPGVPGRGYYRTRFPARLPTSWPRRFLILLSNTPYTMWRCSGSPVLFFAVVAFVVCR